MRLSDNEVYKNLQSVLLYPPIDNSTDLELYYDYHIINPETRTIFVQVKKSFFNSRIARYIPSAHYSKHYAYVYYRGVV